MSNEKVVWDIWIEKLQAKIDDVKSKSYLINMNWKIASQNTIFPRVLGPVTYNHLLSKWHTTIKILPQYFIMKWLLYTLPMFIGVTILWSYNSTNWSNKIFQKIILKCCKLILKKYIFSTSWNQFKHPFLQVFFNDN